MGNGEEIKSKIKNFIQKLQEQQSLNIKIQQENLKASNLINAGSISKSRQKALPNMNEIGEIQSHGTQGQ